MEASDYSRPIMLHVCKDGTVSIRDKRTRQPVFNGVALPVFSVDTVKEATAMQVRFCRLQYVKHPHPKGPNPWFRLTTFSGEVEDLERVAREFRAFYAVLKKRSRRCVPKKSTMRAEAP